jgi:hypothetical protein
MQAHRTHFYQRATNLGFSVPAIIACVALVNALLVALAFVSASARLISVDIVVLVIGAGAVAALLRHLTRDRR